jgi:transposase-like protein
MLDIQQYFCPNEQYKSYGLRAQGNLIKAGTYSKKAGAKQLFRCKICGKRFSETHSAIFLTVITMTGLYAALYATSRQAVAFVRLLECSI